MEEKIDKIKLIQYFNRQKWGNHISKICKFEPVCATCGYDHPSKSHNDYVCQNIHDHSDKCIPLDYVYCINFYGNNPAFDKRCKVSKEIQGRAASEING